MRKLLISCLVHKYFSDLQITRSQIKKEEIDEKASEKASHPSWSSAITRKYGVVQNHFWYTLIAPPFPPLSPQSSVFPVCKGKSFFSRNLQYIYLNFLSAEFFPLKTLILLRRSVAANSDITILSILAAMLNRYFVLSILHGQWYHPRIKTSCAVP